MDIFFASMICVLSLLCGITAACDMVRDALRKRRMSPSERDFLESLPY